MTTDNFQDVKKYLPPLLRAEEHLLFKRGQVIFYRGHLPYGLYIVKEGKVGLIRSLGESRTPKKIVLAGNFFGEEVFVEGTPYECTAFALTDVQVVFFAKSAFSTKKASASASAAEHACKSWSHSDVRKKGKGAVKHESKRIKSKRCHAV